MTAAGMRTARRPAPAGVPCASPMELRFSSHMNTKASAEFDGHKHGGTNFRHTGKM
jgi:hypothetical protein